MSDGAASEGRSRRATALAVSGVLLLCLGMGTLVYWAWPDISWRIGLVDERWPYPSKFAPEGAVPTDAGPPAGNRVVIPRLGVDQPIFDSGSVDRALRDGVYRHPEAATPGGTGAVVLAGHRNRRQFALINRLRSDDVVLLYWRGEEYAYAVHETFVTTPDDTGVLVPGEQSELRLYTCRPRVFDDTRFVLIADPLENE